MKSGAQGPGNKNGPRTSKKPVYSSLCSHPGLTSFPASGLGRRKSPGQSQGVDPHGHLQAIILSSLGPEQGQAESYNWKMNDGGLGEGENGRGRTRGPPAPLHPLGAEAAPVTRSSSFLGKLSLERGRNNINNSYELLRTNEAVGTVQTPYLPGLSPLLFAPTLQNRNRCWCHFTDEEREAQSHPIMGSQRRNS